MTDTRILSAATDRLGMRLLIAAMTSAALKGRLDQIAVLAFLSSNLGTPEWRMATAKERGKHVHHFLRRRQAKGY